MINSFEDAVVEMMVANCMGDCVASPDYRKMAKEAIKTCSCELWNKICEQAVAKFKHVTVKDHLEKYLKPAAFIDLRLNEELNDNTLVLEYLCDGEDLVMRMIVLLDKTHTLEIFNMVLGRIFRGERFKK